MRVQDFVSDLTEKKMGELFNAARTIPADRLDWKPATNARSALDQLQEIAFMPQFYIRLLREKKMWEFTAESMQIYNDTRSQWTTLEACETACKERTAEFLDIARNANEEDLDIIIHLPFNGGMSLTLREILMFHYWNMAYHEGQIYYIGSLLEVPEPV